MVGEVSAFVFAPVLQSILTGARLERSTGAIGSVTDKRPCFVLLQSCAPVGYTYRVSPDWSTGAEQNTDAG
jgi:hypothetical protein